ncbi:MAG: hypothetical protein R3C28_04240 [Pirellulaceae bacterium]
MSRRRRPSEEAVSLFPFLAVLICTMGALIVLLVVMVQQARAAAVDPTEIARLNEQIQQANEQRQLKVEENQWRIEMLQQSRETTQQQLVEKRLELSHLEDHIRALRQKIQGLEDRAAALTAEESDFDADQVRKEINRLESELELAKRELDKEKQQYQQQSGKFAIVAYDGPNGTKRRPVYIECMADRVILRPENIVLTGNDFQEPLTNDNPLALALRAKREYLARLSSFGDQDEPYPLLIVRPDGTRAYAAARAAMAAWDSEFGYELIPADMPLAFPDEDPHLVDLMRTAVEDGRERRRQLEKLASRYVPRRARATTFRASSSGGFVAQGGGDGSGDEGGFGGSQDSSGFGSARSGAAGAPDVNGVAATGDGSNEAIGAYPYGGNAGQGSGGESAAHGYATGSTSADPSDGSIFSRTSPTYDNEYGGGSGDGSGGPGRAEFADSSNVGPYGSEEWSGPYAGSESNGAKGPTGKNSADGGSFENGQTATDSSMSQGDVASGQGTANGNQAQGSRATTAGQGGAASAGGSAAADGGAAGGSINYTGMMGAQPASLAKSRGSNWGLPNRSQGATGITRPISVILSSDHLYLLPESGSREKVEPYPFQESVQESVDPLVASVWERMRSWGVAGQSMYWKPVLSVDVQPNAESEFAQLVSLLENSGIVVQRKTR